MTVRALAAPAPPPLPYRQLSRYGNEYLLSSAAALARLAPRRFDRGIILLLLLRQCAADWVGEGIFSAPAGPLRSFSINGLATSLDRPFETVRRHVQQLVDHGLCVSGPGGVAINPAPAAAPHVIAFLTAVHDLFIRLIEDHAPARVLPAPPAPGRTPPLENRIAAALDVNLMPFEGFRGKAGDWTSMLLWLGVGVANVRHITEDAALSARYAHDSTPDALRHPAAIERIADRLDLSRATAWRHRQRLADANVLARSGDGWIIATEQLRAEAIEESVVTGVRYQLRRMGELVAQGLDPHAAPALYLTGRQPYLPL